MLEKISDVAFKISSPYPTRVFLHFPACHVVACCTRFFLFPGGLFPTCLIQTFGFHTQERTDLDQDPGKIVFIAHLILFSLFRAKLIRIYF